MLLNKLRKINREIKQYLETNETWNTLYQNLWDATEAVLGRKFIVINAHIKNQEKVKINNLTLDIKEPEKEEQSKPKVVEGRK